VFPLAALLLAVCGCGIFGCGTDVVSAVSPDGRNEIRLTLNPLSYEILRDGVTMVAKSRIALRVDGQRLMKMTEDRTPVVSGGRLLGKVRTPSYKKSEVNLNGQETLVDYGTWAVRLVARDDGVAYRFETRLPGRVRIDGERADVTLPSPSSTCWVNFGRRFGCEETLNVTLPAKDLKTNDAERRLIYLPFAYGVGGKTVLITESDVRDYPIWNLDENEVTLGSVSLKSRFAGWPKRTYRANWSTRLDQGGRNICVEKHADWLVETEGTRTYPWRTFLLADKPMKLCEADIVYALAAPADKASDFSWVRPGKVAWDWWNDWFNQGVKNCTTKTYERYIDFAAHNGIEYVILDEGWSKELNIWEYNPKVDVPGLVRYAKQKGVGIILWLAWAQAFGDEEHVAEYFARLGVAGFKVDFMDRGDAEVARFLEKFAAVCAKYRLVVDYHGVYRPTGLHRRYPNILNYEGIHGLEQMKWNDGDTAFLRNDVKAFFVRMSAGPMDYTPGAMDNYAIGSYPKRDRDNRAACRTYRSPGSLGSRAHQMALMAMYEAPLQMLCDSPRKYQANAECLRFMAETPVVWDDVRGLDGHPDRYAVVARRKGGAWYVAGITGDCPHIYTLDTSFLPDGDWKAELFRDDTSTESRPTSYAHERLTVRKGEQLVFRMIAGGGFIVRFSK